MEDQELERLRAAALETLKKPKLASTESASSSSTTVTNHSRSNGYNHQNSSNFNHTTTYNSNGPQNRSRCVTPNQFARHYNRSNLLVIPTGSPDRKNTFQPLHSGSNGGGHFQHTHINNNSISPNANRYNRSPDGKNTLPGRFARLNDDSSDSDADDRIDDYLSGSEDENSRNVSLVDETSRNSLINQIEKDGELEEIGTSLVDDKNSSINPETDKENETVTSQSNERCLEESSQMDSDVKSIDEVIDELVPAKKDALATSVDTELIKTDDCHTKSSESSYGNSKPSDKTRASKSASPKDDSYGEPSNSKKSNIIKLKKSNDALRNDHRPPSLSSVVKGNLASRLKPDHLPAKNLPPKNRISVQDRLNFQPSRGNRRRQARPASCSSSDGDGHSPSNGSQPKRLKSSVVALYLS